ncbi:serine/threonine protein kinase-like protein [Zopfia rhizophila CBS 207.26]|uniref:Serine/threonine protein kinase-like protein n=1 Tax=Zopfia rhizophila CBS 207.26 TaxID=1314779 RepID=A0A6A6EJ34_9PEZI|nr:serine/threonine protein kinase-like protein [Zopfia rhizophila CBS 207.26]
MTSNPPKSPNQFRFSRQGFQPLDNNNDSRDDMAGTNYQTTDIPLQTVVSHTPSHAPTAKEETTEKGGLFHRGHGRRKLQKIDSKTGVSHPGDDDDEKTALNRMGRLYTKILNFSIVTRYMIYVAPLAILLAIPIILASTVFDKPRYTIGGANMRLFFIWIEIVWLSLWACKVIAHFLPNIFEFLVGVVSPGVRKYAMLLRALEKPLSIVFWMIVTQVTFPTLISTAHGWRNTMISILRAALISSCIFLGERLLIQLISISYHRKQFDGKIKESKRNIYLLGLLYDASRALFPAYCNEFAEEDYIIQDSLQLSIGSKKATFSNHARSGSGAPMRLLQDVGRFGDKVTSVFGTVAQEITGKKVFDPNSAHSIVLEALDKNRSAEALARRIWMSFVVEGKNSLYQEDLVEVMSPGGQKEAEECFAALDRDGNGDISLDEMILTVTEFGRERKAIATSMHDVDQAINALDGLLGTIVFIVCIFIFVAFLSPSFVGTLTTSATALLSLSFVFAATCQEVLGSCIFLFVKHPYDIGDRVDLSSDQLTVEHISLLYTVFKRVQNGKMVQIPNIVLNNLWVENITRSKAMREQVSIFVNFDTTFEDVNILKQEMQAFVRDPQNNRDFHPDIEIEVVSIAEMNKLELKCEIRHKSNWSNEALRASRRSKFMCALVLALRRIPIYGPGGGDAALGDVGKPSWSVAISPADAMAARDQFNADKEAKRLYPPKKPDLDDGNGNGKSSSTDYLGVGNTESKAISNLNSRNPGTDPVRDDTWNNRDDVSTIGRPSTDARPDLDEVRGLLHKESSRGKRKQLSPTPDQPRQGMPPIPIPVVPSPQAPTSGYNYAQPPYQRTQPNSPSSISTGHIEEFQYQQMMPPPRSQSRPAGSQPPEGNAFAASVQQPVQAPQMATQSPTGSNNPYRSPSLKDQHPYRQDRA